MEDCIFEEHGIDVSSEQIEIFEKFLFPSWRTISGLDRLDNWPDDYGKN
jgi:hypothetical protein